MFAANAKSVSGRIEVAALLGHASADTAKLHYAQRRLGTGVTGVRPTENDVAALRHRSSVATPTPYSRATSSSVAFSGGSNRATARSLNAFPYRATASSHHRPQIHRFYRGDNYSDAGGGLGRPRRTATVILPSGGGHPA
jgi:hypothetical protein